MVWGSTLIILSVFVSLVSSKFSTCLSRASSSFTYPLFGPLFFRSSEYSQWCFSLEHVPQLGLLPSHLNFLFLQRMHAILFGRGTASFAPPPKWSLSPSNPSKPPRSVSLSMLEVISIGGAAPSRLSRNKLIHAFARRRRGSGGCELVRFGCRSPTRKATR